MKTYTYHLLLRNPVTKDCKVMTIVTDCDGYLEASEVLRRLSIYEDIPQGYTLMGLNVGLVKDTEIEEDA